MPIKTTPTITIENLLGYTVWELPEGTILAETPEEMISVSLQRGEQNNGRTFIDYDVGSAASPLMTQISVQNITANGKVRIGFIYNNQHFSIKPESGAQSGTIITAQDEFNLLPLSLLTFRIEYNKNSLDSSIIADVNSDIKLTVRNIESTTVTYRRLSVVPLSVSFLPGTFRVI